VACATTLRATIHDTSPATTARRRRGSSASARPSPAHSRTVRAPQPMRSRLQSPSDRNPSGSHPRRARSAVASCASTGRTRARLPTRSRSRPSASRPRRNTSAAAEARRRSRARRTDRRSGRGRPRARMGEASGSRGEKQRIYEQKTKVNHPHFTLSPRRSRTREPAVLIPPGPVDPGRYRPSPSRRAAGVARNPRAARVVADSGERESTNPQAPCSFENGPPTSSTARTGSSVRRAMRCGSRGRSLIESARATAPLRRRRRRRAHSEYDRGVQRSHPLPSGAHRRGSGPPCDGR
jgi:hypothetical protein